ncbi:unnamed protein product [Linum trigynum]|uniref:Methyltransferase-like protein 22 n=1 Tax=Linum trigynum TaxID=586398 RepID=A0AAV2DX74_9ROSI
MGGGGEDFGEEKDVTSEVHLGCPSNSSGLHVTHFTITIPIPTGVDCCRCSGLFKRREQVPMDKPLYVDDDGDLVLTRRSSYQDGGNVKLAIQHIITSSIRGVGLQVWKAELVLSDFVLHKMLFSSEFDGIISLELGAGTGLVGMLVGHVAKTVFLTDRGHKILANCGRNVHLNRNVLQYKGSINVRELDWTNSWPPIVRPRNDSLHERVWWTSSEVEEAENASILLAADVIYSDDLTDALFGLLETLMSLGSEKVLYLALEKRYNFSLSDLDIVANGYSHFRSFVRSEEECKEELESCSPFVGRCIDLSRIPKYIREYERGNDLELWEIKYDKQTHKSPRSQNSQLEFS